MILLDKIKQKVSRCTSAEQEAETASQTVSNRMMLALEPRYLYDGAGLITGFEGLAEPDLMDAEPILEPVPDNTNPPDLFTEEKKEAQSHDTSDDSTQEDSASSEHTDSLPSILEDPVEQQTDIVIIDSGVEDVQILTQELSEHADIYILESDRDGVVQINEILNLNEDVDALHIFSHGSSGSVNLGNIKLSTDNFEKYGNLLQDWGDSLSPEGEIQFYGCHVGAGESGTDFISQLSELTGADVAASTDSSGTRVGENWELEKSIGIIDSAIMSKVDFGNADISLSTAETDVTLDGSGNLVVTDINNTETWDNINLSTDGNYIYISDLSNILTTSISGATGGGSHQIAVSLGTVGFTGDIIINTMGGDDLLTIDFNSGMFTRDITYNGGTNVTADGDVMELAGGSFTSRTYNFVNANDGSINQDGLLITYTGLEPITSNITAQNVVLNFSDLAETIDVINSAGQTKVSSTAAETITFNNPTNSLIINTGNTNDTVNLWSLGTGFSASVVINGDGGDDTITAFNTFSGDCTINGGAGNDTIFINGSSVKEVFGEDGNDSIANNQGTVSSGLEGGNDNDTISNNGHAGYIKGNSGNDLLTSNNTLTSGLAGGDGSDTVTNNGIADYMEGNDGNNHLTNNGKLFSGISGGNNNDTITNNGSANYILANDGNDEITNNGDVDKCITGGDGDDTITNNGSADHIKGNDGADSILNNKTVVNNIYGGRDSDTITNNGAGSVVYIYGNDGVDTITNHGFAIGVSDGNNPITVNDDNGIGYGTDEDTSFTTANVLANDIGLDLCDICSSLIFSVDTTGTKGLVTSNGDGTFMYNPNGQFEYLANGETFADTFTYSVTDSNGSTSTGTVTITVNGLTDISGTNPNNTGAGITFQTNSNPIFGTGRSSVEAPTQKDSNNYPQGSLYLPDDKGLLAQNGYAGSPYSAGSGSLIQAMLNSITGSVSGNLGSNGGFTGFAAPGAEVQPYTPEENNDSAPEGENNKLDEDGLGVNTGINDDVYVQDGVDKQNQGHNSDDESGKKKLLEEDEGETNKQPGDNNLSAFKNFQEIGDPMIFPGGFMAEIREAAGQFESSRLSLLSAVQDIANGSQFNMDDV